MNTELKFFFIKLATLLVLTPIVGFGLLRFLEYFERVWKTNKWKQKWLMTCVLFFMLACIGGFLR